MKSELVISKALKDHTFRALERVRGIEPPSESLLTSFSPSAATIHLFQEVYADVVRCVTSTMTAVIVGTVEVPNVMIALIEMVIEVFSAIGANHKAANGVLGKERNQPCGQDCFKRLYGMVSRHRHQNPDHAGILRGLD